MGHLPHDIRDIEEFTMNAWPCLRQVLLDGWILRFAGGYTRRSNSVNPLYPGTLHPLEKVRGCEEMFEKASLTPVFKLTPASFPPGLHRTLLDEGYRREPGASVQLVDLRALDLEAPAGVSAWDRPSNEWIEAYGAFTARDAARRATLQALLENIVPRALFVAVPHDGQIASVAMAVAQPPWVGLFNMATDPSLRRRGLGRRVVAAVLYWGRDMGATTGCLQVSPDNDPAIGLYSQFGFREAYQYHYFVKS
jgi:N-acetylglutamate synthase